MFDVFYFGDNPALLEHIPNARKVNEISEIKSLTRMYWLVDDNTEILDYSIFQFRPDDYDINYTHIWKCNPTTYGGLQLLPKKSVGLKQVDEVVCRIDTSTYGIFPSVVEGLKNSVHDWYWVVTDGVKVLDDFQFDYVPEIWDKGKIHVWQKVNPKTGLVYDRGGVELHPKVPVSKRPKCVASPASSELEYPVYHVPIEAHKKPLQQFYQECSANTKADMFYVVDTFSQAHSGFSFDYYPTSYDKKYVHIFGDEHGNVGGIKLFPRDQFLNAEYTNDDIIYSKFDNLKVLTSIRASEGITWPIYELEELTKEELDEIRLKAKDSQFVFTIDRGYVADESVVNSHFKPNWSDYEKIHVWQKFNPITQKLSGYGGLRLWPTAGKLVESLTTEDIRLNRLPTPAYVRQKGCEAIPFDIAFLSYHEEHAEERYNALLDRGYPVVWVKNVEGIFNAHKRAAELVNTHMFWVVDADAEITDDFDFSYMPDVYAEDTVHVWASKNPVNGLEYGYGGVKLFPTQLVRDASSWGLDFTTGLTNKFKVMPQVSCVTRFNTGPYETWRSAFRECTKLLIKGDTESVTRYEAWANSKNSGADFASDATHGAEDARAFADKNRDNIRELDRINDYEWLRNHYAESMARC